MADNTCVETVVITLERLKQLEAQEAKIKAKNALKVKSLNEYNKEHPEKVLARVKRYQDLHRDKINARRRELRKLRKEAKDGDVQIPGTDIQVSGKST